MAAAAILGSRFSDGSPERAMCLERYDRITAHLQYYICKDGDLAESSGASLGSSDPAVGGMWLRALFPDSSSALPTHGSYYSESHYHVVGTLFDAATAFAAL